MLGLGVTMLAGKGQQLGVLSPAGHGGDAFVNVDRTSFARMVRAQFAHHVGAEFVHQWLGRLGVFHSLSSVMAGWMGSFDPIRLALPLSQWGASQFVRVHL
jgi:hypothetical protein